MKISAGGFAEEKSSGITNFRCGNAINRGSLMLAASWRSLRAIRGSAIVDLLAGLRFCNASHRMPFSVDRFVFPLSVAAIRA